LNRHDTRVRARFFPARDKKAIVFEPKQITVDALVHFMEDKAVNYKPSFSAGAKSSQSSSSSSSNEQAVGDGVNPTLAELQRKVMDGVFCWMTRFRPPPPPPPTSIDVF
jgi:hypothetical protein